MLLNWICLLSASSTLLLAQQGPRDDKVPSLISPEADTVKESVREARSKLFNVRVSFSMLEPVPGRVGNPFVIVDFGQQPELPHEKADTIVLGEVTRLQPFLTSDRKGLYNEYTVKIVDSIKAHLPEVIVPGYTLTLVRQGGAARLPDGRVVKHNIMHDITPAVGQQYLMFLQHLPELEAFAYIKLWLIQEGKMKALFPDDLSREQNGQSEYAGKPASELSSLLKIQR
jgi:hypothetical protein